MSYLIFTIATEEETVYIDKFNTLASRNKYFNKLKKNGLESYKAMEETKDGQTFHTITECCKNGGCILPRIKNYKNLSRHHQH